MADEAAHSTWVDLLRHGQPEGGQRYRGSLDDPLSHLGWEQMHAAIKADDAWDVVVTSPLLRCHAFARAVARERALPLYTEEAFREIGFGTWEGLRTEEILARDGSRLAAFWSDPEANTPPGGEPLSAFHARVAAGWQRCSERFRSRRVLIIAHGGVIRMILACVLDVPPGRLMAGVHVPYACRSRIRIDHTEHGVLRCLMAHGGTG